ncbi:MAG: hypothetical protein K0R33_2288 [Mycobacterium sp.]|nr:hypothetical protein [Mycobacterium sp.]
MAGSRSEIPSGRVRRVMPLAGFTARAAGGRLVAGLSQRAGNVGAVERFHERTADRYAELLGHSKGVLMKAGQMMSLLDYRAVGTGGFEPYQAAMMRLLDDAPPMHPTLVREILDGELGETRAYFTEFDDKPIAAASIGQVHRATLIDGRQVVIKIQYPGVAGAIRDDLANTEMLATFLRFTAAAAGLTADVRPVAREAAALIAEEIDYRHEATSISAFSDLYRGHPFIRIPDLIPEASTDRVLTMTYIDGMSWAQAKDADQDLRNTWAEVISRFSQANLRHANLLHVDPHPGNYRFNSDGTVGFLDFGCIKVLPEMLRQTIVGMTRAVLDGRKDDYRTLMVSAGFLEPDSDLTADELYRWQSDILYESVLAPQPATYTPESIQRVVRGIFDARAADHPMARMNAPDDFVFVSRLTLAVTSVAAGLRATLPIRAMFDDIDGVVEPVTELGKQHHAWVRDRGLPNGLDHHDHP